MESEERHVELAQKLADNIDDALEELTNGTHNRLGVIKALIDELTLRLEVTQ